MDASSVVSGRPPAKSNVLPPAQRRQAMVGVLIAIALAVLDTAIANTALPTIAAKLAVSPDASVWIVTVYQLTLVAVLLPLAALGEIVGQRRIHLGGLAIFTAASLFCACAWSLPSLVIARALQGLGAGAIMAVNIALIRFIYPPERLGQGVGRNALVVAISFVVGPTVASAILLLAPWPWLFAVNVPAGLIGLALGRSSIPETLHATHRFDWLSALLSGATFALLVLGLGEAVHAAPWPRIAAEWAGAAGCATWLLRRQAGHEAPMLAADLLRRPLFALSAATAIGAFAAQGLAFVSLPFLLQHGFGFTQVETGFLITPWPVVVAVMAPIAGSLSDRWAPGLLGGIGLAVMAIGLALLATMSAPLSPVGISWRLALCGAGFGFFQAPNVRAMMASAPLSRSGSAGGMVSLVRLLGQTTGAALVAACYAVFGTAGPASALALGAGFAAAASIASLLRLATKAS